jgi:hypothetical protein
VIVYPQDARLKGILMPSWAITAKDRDLGINGTGFIKGRQNKALLFVFMILGASFFIPGEGGAMHSEVSFGECAECHTGNGGSFTFKGADLGSTCLRCHQAPNEVDRPTLYYVATPEAKLTDGNAPLQLSPGGDFAYLKKNYTWKLPGGQSGASYGYHHGHNIVAISYGYAPDAKNTIAPGGDYPSTNFTCVSCHDPHAIISKVTSTSYTGSYRLLGGKGYMPKMIPGIKAFTAETPIAVSPSQYNRSEASTDTRIAYGIGMSEWCLNCHPNTGGHKAGNNVHFSSQIVLKYNSYVKTGDLNGNSGASYTSLVPFEEGINDASVLSSHADISGRFKKGPDLNANVMCLTCHRAHASGFDHMMRWDNDAEYIVYESVYPGVDNESPQARGRTVAELQQAYYGRPASFFAVSQRNLCNKCHVND